jgi:Lhr-like helicase
MAAALSDAEIKELTKKHFGKTPCKWQISGCREITNGRNVILRAPTGGGKTLAFLIPLALDKSLKIIIVTPLTALGVQHSATVKEAGFSAIALNEDTATTDAFTVSIFLQKIAEYSFRTSTVCG